jgi:uncharacterized protein Yka (UPF0111/DUF47 family)
VPFLLTFYKDSLLESLSSQSALVARGSKTLAEAVQSGDGANVSEKLEGLCEEDRKRTEVLLEHLTTTLLTPVDHEDVLRLSLRFSSILREVTRSARQLALLGPASEPAKELAGLVEQACVSLVPLVKMLGRKKFEVGPLRVFDRLRERASLILSETLAELSGGPSEQLGLLRERELLRPLCEAVHCAKYTAQDLLYVALKNG